ncbi:MAG TPA: hypothetical protein VKB35_19515, partial [Ktedonobacteraceae bacterium]|nr:hypothetical protein [Ktedonobacteraceae bacterium]
MKQQKRPYKQLHAERFYALLLCLYPRAHRQHYGPPMLQAFRDHYRETREVHGRIGITFWLEVLADETKSILREQLSSIQGGIATQWILKQQGILFGLLLGVLAIGTIVWTNVLFPNFESDSEYETTYAIGYLVLFLFFVFVGFLASRKTRRLLSGTWAGAITALLGFGVAMLTFFVVDNVWLDIVSHQADKIYGFQHSTFHTMRDYINA